MAWIESHQNLQRHPKTLKAAAKLSVPVPTLIGHLHCLWWWCLDFAQDGDLTGFDHAEIAQAALWNADPTAFVNALLQCGQANRPGFLEMNADHLLVHDWSDYTGRLIERRKADASRKRAIRRTSVGHPQDGVLTACVTVPNRTVPNRTVPEVPSSPKKTARHEGRAPPDPRVEEIRSAMRAEFGFPDRTHIDPIPNPAKEGQFIKKMLGRGFTPMAILAVWRGKVKQRGRFVSMVWVNDDIREEVKHGEPGEHPAPDSGEEFFRGLPDTGIDRK